VELNAFPGRRLVGRVTYVYPTLQQEARTVKARIVLANPGGRIKPGMYATVRLSSPTGTVLSMPASALVETGERTFVFVETSAGNFAPRDVRVGRRAGDYVEVLSGVGAGQCVVTSAQFLIDSESNLGDVMRSMIGAGGSGSMGDKGADMSGMKMPSAVRK
jgi:multidrug efflux pump subunit AcrA (membrane-fusion protein)